MTIFHWCLWSAVVVILRHMCSHSCVTLYDCPAVGVIDWWWRVNNVFSWKRCVSCHLVTSMCRTELRRNWRTHVNALMSWMQRWIAWSHRWRTPNFALHRDLSYSSLKVHWFFNFIFKVWKFPIAVVVDSASVDLQVQWFQSYLLQRCFLKQGVYNSWKYWKYWKSPGIWNSSWKSPGFLLMLLEKFIISSVIFVHSGTVMSVGRSSSSHAHTKTFQNSYLYVHWYSAACHFIVRIIVILRRFDQCKKSTGNLLNVSWKSPGNLLGWICRHPVFESDVLFSQWVIVNKYFVTGSLTGKSLSLLFFRGAVWATLSSVLQVCSVREWNT